MMVGWIPFLQPIPELVSVWYLLCIPLAIGISLVYKAIWLPEDGPWFRQSMVMAILLLLAMVGVAIGLGLITEVILPRI